MRKSRMILAAIVAATTVIAGAAWATPSIGFVGTNISLGRFEPIDIITRDRGLNVMIKTRGETDVHVVSNTISIGGESGWHTHPGPSLITVKQGTITAYEDDCTSTVYEAGEGFIDSGDHRHNVRNEGTVEAVTVAVQLLPAGAVRRIDADGPDC